MAKLDHRTERGHRLLERLGYSKKEHHEMPHRDEAQDRELIGAMIHKHERHLHEGEPLTKFARGGMPRGHGAKTRINIINLPHAPVMRPSPLALPVAQRMAAPMAPRGPMVGAPPIAQPLKRGGRARGR